jgi:DNA processing protein
MLSAMSIATVGAKLVRSPGLTAEHVQALTAAAQGDRERLCEPEIIAQVELPPAARAFLRKPDQRVLEGYLAWLHRSGARLLLWGELEYPVQLAAIPGAPAALYVMGDISALSTAQLAIVGSRGASPPGRAIAQEFAEALALAGLTITSGLAAGIDTAGHQGALAAGGRTVAVVGTGLDRVYPRENAALAVRIRAGGALVSEFPPGTRPQRQNFPRRNRVISGLALGTLVVEAAENSGSLITAGKAADQGREVFAVPGSIRNPLSRGCNRLIRDGAHLVEEPADVLAGLGLSNGIQRLGFVGKGAVASGVVPPGDGAPLDKEYEMLLDALGFEPATIDALTARSGLSGESVASMLLILELEGRIAPFPGGLYGRLSK